jgi:hypothetical protein
MIRSKQESKRVAELLSQLPPDLDVEGLVSQALAAVSKARRHEGAVQEGASAHKRGAQQGSYGGGGVHQGDSSRNG